jgi:hypothetical protein
LEARPPTDSIDLSIFHSEHICEYMYRKTDHNEQERTFELEIITETYFSQVTVICLYILSLICASGCCVRAYLGHHSGIQSIIFLSLITLFSNFSIFWIWKLVYCGRKWLKAQFFCEYDEMLYPGQVRKLGDQEVQVSVMTRSGKHYKWPTPEDCIFYPISNVLMKLQPPTARPNSSSRSHQTFGFTENWWSRTALLDAFQLFITV